jgi:hypothetical protein
MLNVLLTLLINLLDSELDLLLPFALKMCLPQFLNEAMMEDVHSKFLLYLATTCGRLVLSHLEAAHLSHGGPVPTNDEVCRSITKRQWSPIPYYVEEFLLIKTLSVTPKHVYPLKAEILYFLCV